MYARPLLPAERARRRPASAQGALALPLRTQLFAMLFALPALLRVRVLPMLALALVLVLGQAAMQIHLIGHAAAAQPAQSIPTTQADDDSGSSETPAYCPECLALCGLDLPLGSAEFAPTAVFQGAGGPAAVQVAAIMLAPLRPRSRAPPTRA